MADPPPAFQLQSVAANLVVEMSPDAGRLIALSPAELRIRSIYNHLTTLAVACLGMFVPLLSLLVVPSSCSPHQAAYLAGAIGTGVLAVFLFGWAFFGNRQEEKVRSGQAPRRASP